MKNLFFQAFYLDGDQCVPLEEHWIIMCKIGPPNICLYSLGSQFYISLLKDLQEIYTEYMGGVG